MDPLHRLQERAFWLPVAALALLSPPLLVVFGRPVTIANVPLLYIYVFAVWLGLIVVSGRMARALQHYAGEPPAAADEAVTEGPRDPHAGATRAAPPAAGEDA